MQFSFRQRIQLDAFFRLLIMVVSLTVLVSSVIAVGYMYEDKNTDEIFSNENPIKIGKSCNTDKLQLVSKTIDNYTNHTIITILNNSDFHLQAANEGWPGNGTSNNPYRISGYYFLNDSENLITIKNTNIHFSIEHNFFDANHTIWRTVYLTNVTNGIYRNNYFNNSGGIGLFSCHNNIIANNTFVANYWAAVYLKSSNTTLIINNTSQGGIYGFQLDSAPFNTIINNTIIDGHESIYLEESNFNNVTNNTIHNEIICNQITPDSLGICADHASNNTIAFNTLISNCAAIYLKVAANTTVINNTIEHDRYGIKLDYPFTQDNVIANNSIRNNVYGVYMSDATRITFSNNLIDTSTGTGINIMNSTEADISANIIVNTTNYGISLDVTTNQSTIQYNDFKDNNAEGSSQGLDNGYQNVFSYNFWADWVQPDQNEDGFVDHPYSIDGERNTTDLYPRTSVNQYHYLTSFTIFHPISGQTLNNTVLIQWTAVNDSFGHVVTYAIYYSSDNGNQWMSLVGGLTGTSYSWDTRQYFNGDFYKLKIVAVCTTGLQQETTTETTFGILNHILTEPTLQSPSPGDMVHDYLSIDWETSTDSWGHEVWYSVFYSYNGGTTWILLVSAWQPTMYTWDLENVPNGDTYSIKVTASCSVGLSASSVLPGTFSINNHMLDGLRVLYPNGGEEVSGMVTIEWEPSVDSWDHTVYYTVHYSPDGGPSVFLLAEDIIDTSLDWNTTLAKNGNNYKVRVEARCSEGLSEIDRSDTVFSINNPSSSSSESSSDSPNPPITTPLQGRTLFMALVIIIITKRGFFTRDKKKCNHFD